MIKECKKCGLKFFWDEQSHTIHKKCLCSDCAKEWDKFFSKNYNECTREYPNLVNPTWSAFINEFIREKVVFT